MHESRGCHLPLRLYVFSVGLPSSKHTEMISTIQIMAVVLLSALSVDAQCRAAGCSGKRDMVPNPDRAIAVSELANRTDAAKAFVGKLVAEQRFKGGVSTGPKGKTLYDNKGTVVGEFSAGAR
jgi:hypothetical protein